MKPAGATYDRRRMPTVFTRIIDGELPGTFVWRDAECVGFLSINPIPPATRSWSPGPRSTTGSTSIRP